MNLRTDFDPLDQLIVGNDQSILFVGIRRAATQPLTNFEVTAFDYNLNVTLWRYMDEVLFEGTDQYRSEFNQLVCNPDQGLIYAVSKVTTSRYGSAILNQAEGLAATNRSTSNVLVTAISYTSGAASWRTLLGDSAQPSQLVRGGYHRGVLSLALRSNTGIMSGQDSTKEDLIIFCLSGETGYILSTNVIGSKSHVRSKDFFVDPFGLFVLVYAKEINQKLSGNSFAITAAAKSEPAILWLAHETGVILEVYKPTFPAEFDSKLLASNLMRFSKSNSELNFAVFFDGLQNSQVLVSVYEQGLKGLTSCGAGCSLCSTLDSSKCLICGNSNGLKLHTCGSASCDGWFPTTTISGAVVCLKCHQSCTACATNGARYSRFNCNGCATGYTTSTSNSPDIYDANWKLPAKTGCFCTNTKTETEAGCMTTCSDGYKYMVVWDANQGNLQPSRYNLRQQMSLKLWRQLPPLNIYEIVSNLPECSRHKQLPKPGRSPETQTNPSCLQTEHSRSRDGCLSERIHPPRCL